MITNLTEMLVHSKQKLNSITKYPSILTLHQIGEKGVLKDEFTMNLTDEQVFATEKIDGTNVRLIYFGGEFIVGSREFLLYKNGDVFFDPAGGIVEAMKTYSAMIMPNIGNVDLSKKLVVVYGELFGGKTSDNAKNYGKDTTGFRAYDIAIFEPELLHELVQYPVEKIAQWREHSDPELGIKTNTPFVNGQDLQWMLRRMLIPDVPILGYFPFGEDDWSHESTWKFLHGWLPTTKFALSPSAVGKAEGMILRTANRNKIVKLRFEDYERTLRKNSLLK